MSSERIKIQSSPFGSISWTVDVPSPLYPKNVLHLGISDRGQWLLAGGPVTSFLSHHPCEGSLFQLFHFAGRFFCQSEGAAATPDWWHLPLTSSCLLHCLHQLEQTRVWTGYRACPDPPAHWSQRFWGLVQTPALGMWGNTDRFFISSVAAVEEVDRRPIKHWKHRALRHLHQSVSDDCGAGVRAPLAAEWIFSLIFYERRGGWTIILSVLLTDPHLSHTTQTGSPWTFNTLLAPLPHIGQCASTVKVNTWLLSPLSSIYNWKTSALTYAHTQQHKEAFFCRISYTFLNRY